MMREALFVLAILLPLASTQAAEARKYAVISLIGDRLTVVTHVMTTGSRIDKNRRESFDLPDATLDNAALGAVADAIEAADPRARVLLLGTRDPAIFAAQSRMLEKDNDSRELLARITGVTASQQATHLVLVSKLRGDAMLRLADGGLVGSGKLEGVGFYVDREMPITSVDMGLGRTAGFLAPFAYFRVTLVDLASGSVLREESVLASTTRASDQAAQPWDAMSAEEKVRALQSLIRGELHRVVPRLLSQR
jgi:hypothetical protein